MALTDDGLNVVGAFAASEPDINGSPGETVGVGGANDAIKLRGDGRTIPLGGALDAGGVTDAVIDDAEICCWSAPMTACA